MPVNDVLYNAAALVNGTTITRISLAEVGKAYTIYHPETDAHQIILANGAETETFIDNISRRRGGNYVEYAALYGDISEMQEYPIPAP